MRRLVLIAALSGVAACAPARDYVYRPAEQATATLAGRAAARYAVPPESPRGSVRVASFGITPVSTRIGEVRTLHVRLAIANNNDSEPWELDTRALRVAFAGRTTVGPAFVSTRPSGGPVVQISPGQVALVDAYFLLPPGAEGAQQVPRFDLLWEVHTSERAVAERTPFDRIRIEPQISARAGFGVVVGPAWWQDPFLFRGPPVIVMPER